MPKSPYVSGTEALVNVYKLISDDKKTLHVLYADDHFRLKALAAPIEIMLEESENYLNSLETLYYDQLKSCVRPDSGMPWCKAVQFMVSYKTLEGMMQWFSLTKGQKELYGKIEEMGFELPDFEGVKDVLCIRPEQIWDEETVNEMLPWLKREKNAQEETKRFLEGLKNDPHVRKAVKTE